MLYILSVPDTLLAFCYVTGATTLNTETGYEEQKTTLQNKGWDVVIFESYWFKQMTCLVVVLFVDI